MSSAPAASIVVEMAVKQVRPPSEEGRYPQNTTLAEFAIPLESEALALAVFQQALTRLTGGSSDG